MPSSSPMLAKSPLRPKLTMAHSMYRSAIPVLAFRLPIRPTCFRSSSRPTTPSPARRAAPAWGLPYQNASLRCTAARSGSSRNLAKARHLPSSSRSLSSGRWREVPEPALAARVTYALVALLIAEREASQTRFHLHVRVETHEQTHFGGRGPAG